MKNLLLILALVAAPLAGQDQKKEEPKEPQVQRLFVLKYADPNQVNNLIRPFTSMATPNEAMHAIAVSATAGEMAAIEDAIKRLDVPSAAPQDVELTTYLLEGSDSDGTSAGPLPKELDSVLTQLKAAFAYKSYRLGDVMLMRGRTGQVNGGALNATAHGWSVPIGNGSSSQVTTRFQVNQLSLSPDGAVHVDGLRMACSLGSSGTPYEVALNTDVDIKEGQKVVVGKMGVNQNVALFLVLMAHVAQ
jgi:hypothetical protein